MTDRAERQVVHEGRVIGHCRYVGMRYNKAGEKTELWQSIEPDEQTANHMSYESATGHLIQMDALRFKVKETG